MRGRGHGRSREGLGECSLGAVILSGTVPDFFNGDGYGYGAGDGSGSGYGSGYG